MGSIPLFLHIATKHQLSSFETAVTLLDLTEPISFPPYGRNDMGFYVQFKSKNMSRVSPDKKQLIINQETGETENVAINLDVSYNEFTYVNCKFKFMVLEFSEIQALTIRDSEIGELIIDTSSIKKLLLVQSKIAQITIKSNLDTDLIYFEDHKVDSKNRAINFFSITRCTVTAINIELVQIGRAEFKQILNLKALQIEGAHLQKFMLDQDSRSYLVPFEIFKIADVRVTEKFVISNSTIATIQIEKSFLNLAVIHQTKSNLTDINADISEELYFNTSWIEKLNVSQGEINKLSILLGEYGEIVLYPTAIKNVFIGSGYRKHKILQLTIKKLDLSSYPKIHETNFRINDLNIGELDLSDFDNRDKFMLSNANINLGRFHLTRLEEATFNSVAFTRLILSDSIIDAARFANIMWPKNHLLEENPLLTKENTEEGVRLKLAEAYRQLKAVCSSVNDKFNALAFQKHEMNEIWHLTNINRKDNIGNWLILGSNKLFSDFGQSLSRPLLWLFIVHSVLYVFLFWTFDLGTVMVDHCEIVSCNPFLESLSTYVGLLNPAHDHVVKGVDIFGVIDVLMRVFSGLFLYYFVRATRKFNLSL